MSPDSIVGIMPSIRCRSEPQIAQAVTFTITSRGSSILGSGTVSQRMSFVPCQQSAFIEVFPNAEKGVAKIFACSFEHWKATMVHVRRVASRDPRLGEQIDCR